VNIKQQIIGMPIQVTRVGAQALHGIFFPPSKADIAISLGGIHHSGSMGESSGLVNLDES